ncbi:DUF2889 domain-containing protein [Pokkaliibacter sp. MBI-7]|uniref:DUF2889 domain-containing protein n=1 Tax=Pokkaliibacter sp. MBI-7 TaxID=3040600 RepID=UPI00244C2F2C|nr:DUF2889 domain-containing protein [Pokkaliibacter sp. MBI-7]MDH2433891.1 DUF2889 domain-containing protein [Pokkaliibacter sp. MBI-7]
MALSQAAPRRLMHTRDVRCQGFLREDGLWDIEGLMQDIKTDETPSPGRSAGRVAAGDPFHLMRVRMTVDLDLLIHAIEVEIASSPFDGCPNISDSYQQLVGTRIGKGWSRVMKERVGGVQGCTHVSELLVPMATTAFQTTWHARQQLQEGGDGKSSGNGLVNTCYSWSENGEAVRRFIPHRFIEAEQNT